MTEAEVIRLPSKRNGWLIKSIVPDAGSLGAVAIEAAKSTFLLTRNPGRLVRTANTVSRIKGSGKNFHEPKNYSYPLPETSVQEQAAKPYTLDLRNLHLRHQ